MIISMNLSKKIATIIVILLMTSVIVVTDTVPMSKGGDVATSTATLPAGAYAADTVQPVCELSVNQNPVGVGQYVLS